MMPDTHESAECRADRRRRSGVRVGCIWGIVLLLALTLYIGAFAIMQHFNFQRWSKKINHALKQQNIAEAAALLEACKVQAPRLTRRADYAVWQSQLQRLHERQQSRRLRFATQLKKLEKALDSENADHLQLTLLLANIARSASDEAELAEVRNLQARCESLAAMRELASAQSGAAELKVLRERYLQSMVLLEKDDFQKFRTLNTQGCRRLQILLQKYYKFPELTAQLRRLQRQYRESADLARQREAHMLIMEGEFEALLKDSSAQNMEQKCRNFLQKYPQSRRAAAVKALLQQLPMLQEPFAETLKRRLDSMERDLQHSRQQFQDDLRKFAGKVHTPVRCELVIQLDDKTLKSWETTDLVRFSQSDAQDISQIKFTTLQGESLQGSFAADGSGSVQISNVQYRGRLYRGKPEGMLPKSYWQERVLDIAYGNYGKNFLTGLAELPRIIKDDPRLPEHVKNNLLEICKRAQQNLKMSPEQYIFSRSVLSYCAAHTPVFAGVSVNGKLNVVGNIAPQTTRWLLLDGKWQRGSNDSVICVVAVAKDAGNYAEMQKKWQEYAAAEKLVVPELPEFLRN